MAAAEGFFEVLLGFTRPFDNFLLSLLRLSEVVIGSPKPFEKVLVLPEVP